MKELSWWEKLLHLHSEEQETTEETFLRRIDEHRQGARAAAEASAKKAADKEKERAKLSELLAHRQEINERLARLRERYQETPCSGEFNLLYYNIRHLTVAKDHEHPNLLTRIPIQDEDNGTWVGERISWVWNDYEEPLHIKHNEHGVLIPRKGKKFKVELVREIENMRTVENSIILRYFPDNHIEIFAGDEDPHRYSLTGPSREDTQTWLRTTLGNAMRHPRKVIKRSGP